MAASTSIRPALAPFTGAWAKLDAATGAALPLIDHGADVASVFERFAGYTTWSTLLRHTGGRALTPQDVQRLCALAYLHDLGKANRGFWARQFEGRPSIGHTNETAALFFTDLVDRPEVRPLSEMIVEWGAYDLFRAVMAHHGRPLALYREGVDEDFEIKPLRRYWQAEADYDPLRELAKMVGDAQARFPVAFQTGPPLPDRSAFVALVCGLVTLADWLGSDACLFPVAGPHFAAREAMRRSGAERAVEERGLSICETPDASFSQAFGDGFAPRGLQASAGRLDLGPIVLIEAETGSGKTEAALWRWLALRRAGLVDGLYFALPTRSAAVQLHERVNRMLRRVFGEGAVNAVLAVPGYLRAGEDEGEALPGFEVVWPDDGVNDSRWAAEHPKRFLSARVAVGTIDQALMAGLRLKHAHFRAAMLARSLLVVDEVHASDTFMSEVLATVLRNHLAFGGHALLLSATLGASARVRLLDPTGDAAVPDLADAEAAAYPALSGSECSSAGVSAGDAGREKRVRLEPLPLIDEADEIAAMAVAAADAGASVLVVRNSVAGAIAVARAAEALSPAHAFKVRGVATLHHGRFAPGDRRLLDEAVAEAFGKGRSARGRVLVGTQTLEQSLDIDADLLITDLAPMDVLLQRIGRLHRHARADRGAFSQVCARILVPGDRDLTRYLSDMPDRHGLGPFRDGQGVYPDLLMIEATLRLIEQNPTIRIPADNRRLVERSLHPEVVEALMAELGVDWERHGMDRGGIACAERYLAQHWSLKVEEAFSALWFPDKEEEVSTRLGGTDRLVEFEPPLNGPFGESVPRLTVPGWMAGGVGAETLPEVVAEDANAVVFRLGERSYGYGRFGLERL